MIRNRQQHFLHHVELCREYIHKKEYEMIDIQESTRLKELPIAIEKVQFEPYF